jgi:hypothetical protein
VLAVNAGGPTAAMAEALVYIDAYHEGTRLRKAQSEIRHVAVRSEAGSPKTV